MSKNKLAIILEENGETKYCCVACPLHYYDKEKLEMHLCTHYKEYRFLCGVCGTGLKRKEHLERHLLGHQEVRPHICPECGKAFKRKEHLSIHRSIHSGDKDQICPLCQRSFYRKDHLQKHLQTHSKLFSAREMFPASDQDIVEIKQEYDEEDIQPFINGEDVEIIMDISQEFGPTEASEQVANLMRPDAERPFACTVCRKTYKRKDHLKLHSFTHLKKDKVCSECGKAFHREEQLLTHMTIHLKAYSLPNNSLAGTKPEMVDHSDIEILPLEEPSLLVPRVGYSGESRPHECPICLRRFKRRQHLKVHSNVHLKNRRPIIWCSLCNEGFQSNEQFESHECLSESKSEGYEDEPEPSSLGAKNENDYPNEFTDFQATEDENAVSLAQEQHLPSPQRVYVCKYCSKPFKRKDHYKIHLHIHTGIKSFFCPDCGKGFYRKDHLQKHSLVHQKGKAKPKKSLPDLYPINMLIKKEIKPEITITAPSNTKLRVPLQIKVPYQVVMSMDNGEQKAVTIDPQAGRHLLS